MIKKQDINIKNGWLIDTFGRYLLFRGYNIGPRAKLPPYLSICPLNITSLPSTQELTAEINRLSGVLDKLADTGCNIIRMPVMWKAIEPIPSIKEELLPEGKEYLNRVEIIVNEFGKRGMNVIIDFHQDIAHEIFGGDGFPDWAIAKDEHFDKEMPENVARDFSWGSNYYDITPVGEILTGAAQVSKHVRETLQSFWLNSLNNVEYNLTDFPVRTHLERTIGLTAEYFKDNEYVIGYCPFNEPHSVGLDEIAKEIFELPDKTTRPFEQLLLPEFYNNAIFEIRKHDKHALVFIEPKMSWTTYNGEVEFEGLAFCDEALTHLDTSKINDERTVFSFHYYDPWMLTKIFPHDMEDKQKEWPKMFASMRNAAECRNMVPFITEFGASQDWTGSTLLLQEVYQNLVCRAAIDLLYQNIERYKLSAIYWNIDFYNTSECKDNWNDENFSLLGPDCSERHLELTARPYPLKSFAEPVELSFDAGSKLFMIVLKGIPVQENAEIYIPVKFHYSSGFEIWCTGNISIFENNKIIWLADAAAFENILILCERGKFNRAELNKRYDYLYKNLRRFINDGSSRSFEHLHADMKI